MIQRLILVAALLLVPGLASARTETLRWTYTANAVPAVRFEATFNPGGSVVDLGNPAPAGGVYSADVTVPDTVPITFVARSVAADGTRSADSNAITRTPVAEPPPPPGTDVKLVIAAAQVTASSIPQPENPPAATVDGLLTTRFSTEGDGQWIRYDLRSVVKVSQLKAAFPTGAARTTTFDVQVSLDAATWVTVLARAKNAPNTSLQTFNFPSADARYVRIVSHGTNVNPWISLSEVEIWTAGGVAPAPIGVPGATRCTGGTGVAPFAWAPASGPVAGYRVYRAGTDQLIASPSSPSVKVALSSVPVSIEVSAFATNPDREGVRSAPSAAVSISNCP